MNKTSYRIFAVAVCIVANGSFSYGAAVCADDDLAIKACVKQYLTDTNILINGVLADPGGLKTKSATESLPVRLQCAFG